MTQPMLACINPDLTYQYATAEYLSLLGWQSKINNVSLTTVHTDEPLFELQHALMLARTKGSASIRWQPFTETTSLWLQLDICWNPDANIFIVNAYRNQQLSARQMVQQPVAGLFDYTPQAVMLLDSENRISQVNLSFSEVTGYSFKDVVGQGPGIVTNREISIELFDHLWHQLMNRGYWEGVLWNRHKDGHNYPAWYSLTANRDENNEVTGFVAQFSDISSCYSDQNRFSHNSHDEKTGLPDEQMLVDDLDLRLLRDELSGRSCAVLLIRPQYNPDTKAELLALLAVQLGSMIREQDLLAFDYQECFALVIDNCPDEQLLEQLASRVETVLDELVKSSDASDLSYELAGAIADKVGLTGELLLDRARVALKSASGEGIKLYETRLGAGSILSRPELEQALIEGWVQLHFNPVYSMQGHKLMAAELTPGINYPEQGLLAGEQFIPQLARYGLMQEFHQQILAKIEPFLRVWDSFEGFESLCLRLEDEELITSTLISDLVRMLVRAEIPPQRLTVIISESQLRLFTEDAEQLKAQGIRLLLDTEGQSLKVDKLALVPDMLLLNAELVEDQMSDDAAVVKVETVIQQAWGLDIEVMAEGVRTTGQMARLTQQGCFRMSGKYVGHFLTLDQMIERLDLEN